MIERVEAQGHRHDSEGRHTGTVTREGRHRGTGMKEREGTGAQA